MGQRVIPVAVTAEYVGGDGVTLGAAGSHNSVVIEYDFRSAGPQWEDPEGGTLIKYVLWTNPQGNTTNRVDLGVSEQVAGYGGKVYHASPTADAMCVAGWAEMIVVGAVISDGKEVTKIKTEPSRFRVLPGTNQAADNEGIAATVADQLQAEIEAVNNTLQETIETEVDNLDDKKVDKPIAPFSVNGEPGQYLVSLGNGRTIWEDAPKPTNKQVEEVLRAHKEWVTTVQNGSLTAQKFTDELKLQAIKDYVTPQMYGAKGNGVADDTDAMTAMMRTGKPVYLPGGVYSVKSTLNYSGPCIFGEGTILSAAALEKVLVCTADDIDIRGIAVDCNEMSGIGISCSGDGYCHITGCEVSETDNEAFDEAKSCAGIYVAHYAMVDIHGNYIHDINRTKVLAYVRSSVGINVSTNGNVNIYNNRVDTVKCYNTTADCDGIYVSCSNPASYDKLTTTAQIYGNTILDATGRFVKTQCNFADIHDNYCALVNLEPRINMKAFDFQYGGGRCAGNCVDFGGISGGSTVFVHADYRVNLDTRSLLIENNEVKVADTVGQAFVRLEAIPQTEAETGLTGACGIVTIRNNTALGDTEYHEAFSDFLSVYANKSRLCRLNIESNHVAFSYLISNEDQPDMSKVHLSVTDNHSDCTRTGTGWSGMSKLFRSNTTLHNIILARNDGITNLLGGNVTVDYDEISCCDFSRYTSSDTQKIQNLPAALGDGTYVHLKTMGDNLVQYYDYKQQNTGFVTKT